MTSVDIIGGVYREICRFPSWDQIYGSGGRAAAALSNYFDEVRLHTFVSDAEKQDTLATIESFGVKVDPRSSDNLVSFEYLHCLSTPSIEPTSWKLGEGSNFAVEAEFAVVFGMMEAVPPVVAKKCVYDPQSAYEPLPFSKTGSRADRLAIVCNRSELRMMTGSDNESAAISFLKAENAEVVVVKCGLSGARVFTDDGEQCQIPAYKCSDVFLIGSGDVFTAAFSLGWAELGMSPKDAADYASKAVSRYAETKVLPIVHPNDVSSVSWDPAILKGGKVYLAGPFRELGQRVLIEEARKHLKQIGFSVFSPVHDIGHGPAEGVVSKDLDAIVEADLVFAILNGSSPGTLFEVGYAKALGKPVYCLAQNMRDQDIKLPVGSGCVIKDDMVSLIHEMSWRA